MDTPRDTGGHVARWSRWEKGATSFGPAGRILATVFLLGGVLLLPGVFAIFALFAVPLLLRDVWKKDWVVPDEPDLPPLPLTARDVEHGAPRSPAQQAFRWIGWATPIGLAVAFAYGSLEAKAVSLAIATIIGFVWFLRGFMSR